MTRPIYITSSSVYEEHSADGTCFIADVGYRKWAVVWRMNLVATRTTREKARELIREFKGDVSCQD